MKQRAARHIVVLAGFIALLSAGSAQGTEQGPLVSYLYRLSNFQGFVPLSWVQLEVDGVKNEIYVLSPSTITVFNEDGMEIYNFNEGGELGRIAGLAIAPSGDIIVLSYAGEQNPVLIRCNVRGEMIEKMSLSGLPSDLSDFGPNRIALRDEEIYLASTNDMRVIITDSRGAFKKFIDLAREIGKDLTEREKTDLSITGFSVDKHGSILITNSAMGRGFRVPVDGGQPVMFGVRGSTAGKFGVPADIASDATGKYVLVADTLRCVVLVFDNNFQFQKEFGFRGRRPGNLVGPMFMTVDSRNRLYVSQLGNRGVNVYQIQPS